MSVILRLVVIVITILNSMTAVTSVTVTHDIDNIALNSVAEKKTMSTDGNNKNNNEKPPFLWGVATAAYQIEGAVHEEGRGDCIWDIFSHQPNKISHNDTGDIACDSYHHMEEDISLLKALGINAYRFSIAWSRILPYGHNDHINVQGVNYYNKLINLLLLNNIEPVVTLYHWDLPQSLENDYHGLLHPLHFQQDFFQFAKVCFDNFGDRVKKWITINEPWTISALGYGLGVFAPGRCSYRERCQFGNSSTESYMVAHNLLNAHAAVVELYRNEYQATQKGLIGITLNHDWAEPFDVSNPWDQLAAEHRREFQLGWFADPIFFGRYPESMMKLVGSERLPKFTESESKRLKGSIDFLGMNHYTSKFYLYRDQDESGKCKIIYSTNSLSVINTNESYHANRQSTGSNKKSLKRKYPRDLNVKQLERDFTRNGGSGWYNDQCTYETKYDLNDKLIGLQAESPWLNVVPWGFYKLLKWIQNRYYGDMLNSHERIPIYITENGCDVPNEGKLSKKKALKDKFRISYYEQYLKSLDRAIEEGVNVQGYFAWSLLDNFEWADGYDKRFGLHHVDFQDPQRRRTAKDSAIWYRDYIYKRQQKRDEDDNTNDNKTDDSGEITADDLLACDPNDESTNQQCSWLAFLSAAFKNSFNSPIHNSISFEE